MADAHRIAEQASLLSHRAYAAIIDKDQDCVGRARLLISQRIADGGATIGEECWNELLQRPWSEIKQRMLEDTAAGRLLRSNSPFSLVIGIADPDRRRQLWRQAKRDLDGDRP